MLRSALWSSCISCSKHLSQWPYREVNKDQLVCFPVLVHNPSSLLSLQHVLVSTRAGPTSTHTEEGVSATALPLASTPWKVPVHSGFVQPLCYAHTGSCSGNPNCWIFLGSLARLSCDFWFVLFLNYWENRVLVPSSMSQKLQLLQIPHHISIPYTACIRIPSLDLSCPGKAPLMRHGLSALRL